MKKFLWVITAIITVAVIVICPFLIKQKVSSKPIDSVVITVWHVDSFEGGKGSRTAFLRKVATNFSKKNKNVSFLVTNYTLEGLKTALSSGKTPDLISYGGCSINLENHAEKIDFSVLDGGRLSNGKRFAVSYLKGRYFKISKGVEGKAVILSKSEFSSPEIACLFAGVHGIEFETLSPIKAYNQFALKKDVTMIGTQRDVIRLINNEQEFTLTAIDSYCDLFQYISLTAKGDSEKFYAREFINYLLSSEVQDKLTSLNMFSVNKSGLYNGDSYFSNGENEKPQYTFSPYAEKSEYDKVCNLALTVAKESGNYDVIVKFLKQL